jgi:hypothetical protein
LKIEFRRFSHPYVYTSSGSGFRPKNNAVKAPAAPVSAYTRTTVAQFITEQKFKIEKDLKCVFLLQVDLI